MKAFGTCVVIGATAVTAAATQYTYNDTGGTVTLGTTGTTLSISGAALGSPAGTMSASCPLTYVTPVYPYAGEWSCVGGSFSVQSNDGSTTLTAAFTSGLFTLQYAYNGHGQIVGYNYALSASIAGSRTLNGKSSAVLGSTAQTLPTLSNYLGTGTIQTGTIDLSQRLEPVYVADTANNRIVRLLDMAGNDWTTLGTAGSGINQFSQPWGISADSSGKIYVSDSGNCRIVRINNMAGLNWTAFGSCWLRPRPVL